MAQSVGMDYLEPFTFNMLRSFLGGLFLVPCILLVKPVFPRNMERKSETTAKNKKLLGRGYFCNILAFATGFQQIGIQYTTVGRAGFITACYIIIVPVIGLTFFHKKCRSTIWVAVALALVGLYLLCITDGFDIGKGDFYIFICSLLFSLHILVIDHFSPLVDGIKMSCIQFFVCGVISAIFAFGTETPVISNIFMAWGPLSTRNFILWRGIYIANHGTKELESYSCFSDTQYGNLVSPYGRWVLLNQKLTVRELIGCVFLMFVAIILAQLPEKTAKKTP